MAVYAQTACTLSTITDVTAVYTYYYLASSTITSNMAPQDNVNPPDETHDAGSRIVVVTYDGNTYTWRDIDPSLSIVDNVITTAVGQLYYIECVKFSDGTYDWGPLMTSSTYAAAKAAYNLSSQALSQANTAAAATALLGGHFIYKTSTSSTNLTPPSANVVENIEATIDGVVTDVTDKPAYWGYNTHIGANGIKLRHNETDLSSWTNSSLIFYDPSQGAKMMELSGSALKFFDVNDSTYPLMSLSGQALNFYQYGTNTAAATLNNNGLKLVKGGIEAGNYTTNPTKFIYLSTEDYSGSPTITINGNNSDWRQIIGSKFGVKNDGTLYASNADIGGKITATSGAIGGWTIGSTFLSTSASGTPGSGVITLSQGIAGPTSDSGVLPANQTWAFTASNNFGVTTTGTLYASGGSFNGRIEATEGYFSSTVTIGNGGTTLSTIEANAKQSQIYLIGVNNGTTGYHFLGTLTLSGQTAEAEIEIHTGAGQNNGAYQNLTVRVNIKRGWQPTTSATAGITVRYEGDPTIVTMGESNCSIIARCTTVGVLNIYMYTPNWGYADGWYQVKGRNWSWVHSGTLVTTAPSEGTAQSITYMNPYTTATNYITNIANAGIYISPANQSPTSGAEGNSIKLDGNGLEIFKDNESVAFYGATTRIGLEQDSSRLLITDSTIQGIDRYNNAYFDITHMGAESPYLITEVINEHLLNSGNIDLTLSELWANIEDDEDFYIIIEYYKQNTSGTIVEYYDTTEETHIKGETDLWSDTYSTYDSTYPNQITITSAYPSILSEGYTLAYKKITLGRIQQVKRPIYRFGEQVAETGGANSFLMGRGTVASGANTLAIGQYNRDNNGYNVDGSSYFIVGGGTNDEHRKNLFEIYKYEPFVRINETPLQTWVMTGEDWSNEGNGTDGYYRIWENGIVEYWQSYKTTLTHYTTTPFNWYGYYCDFTFPDIFKDPPCITYNVTIGSGFAIPAGILQLTRQSARLFAIGSASGSQTVTFYMHIVGRYGTSE